MPRRAVRLGVGRPFMVVPHPSKLFHRFPFVLTDRGLESRPDGSAASRLLSIDDSLAEGSPGSTYGQSLLVEAMAQTAALFAEETGRKQSGMLVGLRRVRFGRPPRVGDRLFVEAKLVQTFGDLVRVSSCVRTLASSAAPTEADHASWLIPEDVLAEGEILISLAGGGESSGNEDREP